MQAQMSVILETIMSALNATYDLSDESARRDIVYLRRAFLQMLNAIVVNDIVELWSAAGLSIFISNNIHFARLL